LISFKKSDLKKLRNLITPSSSESIMRKGQFYPLTSDTDIFPHLILGLKNGEHEVQTLLLSTSSGGRRGEPQMSFNIWRESW
jgi:hypothetical protein